MNDTRSAPERLDALLNGLEEEVMRGERGVSCSNIGAMRSQLERLIEVYAGGGGREAEPSRRARATASTMELLGRWTRIGQRIARRTSPPQVRVAFSGERESGKEEDREVPRRRRGES